MREFRGNGVSELQPGQEIKVDTVFAKGDVVYVVGTSKGRGFQGVVKRHHFGGGFRTHGQSDRERAPGSIGSSSYPSRVFKGHRMAGRMGGEQITVRNLKVVGVIPDSNFLLVKGSVPGAINGYRRDPQVDAHNNRTSSAMELEVYKNDGTKSGEKVKLSGRIFGIEPNQHVIYRAVKTYLGNQRQGTSK